MVVQVDLKGSSYEIGLQHGQALRAQIMRQVSFYRDMFKLRCKLEWPQVLEVSKDFKPTLLRLAPNLLQEMQGIADGLDRTDIGVLDIIALNCRSEIALGKWTDGCTSLGWNVTGQQRKQFLSQNWDWHRRMEDNLALMSIATPSKPKIWMVTEAGIIGKIGFNSSSVGVCLNAIRARPMITTLLPIHVLLRLVLESDSVSKALDQLKELQGCATSAHMLIADPTGSCGVEISPHGMRIIEEDEDRVVVHSNHFVLTHPVDEPPWLADSPTRIKRIRELCGEVIQDTQEGSTVDIERVRTLFRDTTNSPASICRQEGPEHDIASIFNIVMQLNEEGPAWAEVVFSIGTADEGDVVQLPW